jgi:hypothetical protein
MERRRSAEPPGGVWPDGDGGVEKLRVGGINARRIRWEQQLLVVGTVYREGIDGLVCFFRLRG